jgi:predicted methyltransferase
MNNPGDDAGPTGGYVLGHSDREFERLNAQARLVDPITRPFFREAGIVPGMRVLDVGSGAGDVAFLVADLVGETGEVAERMSAEALANESVLVGRSEIVAWSRV